MKLTNILLWVGAVAVLGAVAWGVSYGQFGGGSQHADEVSGRVDAATEGINRLETRLAASEASLARLSGTQSAASQVSDESFKQLQAQIAGLAKQLADKSTLEKRLEALEKAPRVDPAIVALAAQVKDLAEQQAKTPDLIRAAMRDFADAQAAAKVKVVQNAALEAFGKDAESYFAALTSRPPLPKVAEDRRQAMRRSYPALIADVGLSKMIEQINAHVRDTDLAKSLVDDLARL